jgi:hypothetical protein
VGASPVFQFSAAPHGGAFYALRDFSPASAFTWTPMQEGTFDIKVTVKDRYETAETKRLPSSLTTSPPGCLVRRP